MTNAESFTNMWQGIHHVALMTRDLDATIAFYRDVLGLKVLFVAPAGEMHGRHASFLPGGSYMGLHFFEYADAQNFAPAEIQDKMPWFPGALHHIAIAIPDEKAGLELRQHLQEHNIQMTEIMDQGPDRNMIFRDNNGIMLEANWPREV